MSSNERQSAVAASAAQHFTNLHHLWGETMWHVVCPWQIPCALYFNSHPIPRPPKKTGFRFKMQNFAKKSGKVGSRWGKVVHPGCQPITISVSHTHLRVGALGHTYSRAHVQSHLQRYARSLVVNHFRSFSIPSGWKHRDKVFQINTFQLH